MIDSGKKKKRKEKIFLDVARKGRGVPRGVEADRPPVHGVAVVAARAAMMVVVVVLSVAVAAAAGRGGAVERDQLHARVGGVVLVPRRKHAAPGKIFFFLQR